jgi:hypothetical protein
MITVSRDLLRAHILAVLSEEDYYGGPMFRVPPAACREAMADAIVGRAAEDPTPETDRAAHVRSAVDDMVSDFLYHHRREDEELPLGSIEAAIKSAEVTVDEIVDRVREALLDALG